MFLPLPTYFSWATAPARPPAKSQDFLHHHSQNFYLHLLGAMDLLSPLIHLLKINWLFADGELTSRFCSIHWGSQVALMVKNLSINAGDIRWVQSQGWEDSLEEDMATHSSILAWTNLWTAENVRLQFMESQRVGHDWSNLACMHAFYSQVWASVFISSSQCLV